MQSVSLASLACAVAALMWSTPATAIPRLSRRTEASVHTPVMRQQPDVRDTTPRDSFDLHDTIAFPAESTLVVLTPELLARFAPFWQVLEQYDNTPGDSTMILSFVFANRIVMPSGKILLHNEHADVPYPDLRAAVVKYPDVAAALKQSGFSPKQVLRIAQSVVLAISNNYVAKTPMTDEHHGVIGTPEYREVVYPNRKTIRGKNILFYRAHRAQMDALDGTNMQQIFVNMMLELH